MNNSLRPIKDILKEKKERYKDDELFQSLNDIKDAYDDFVVGICTYAIKHPADYDKIVDFIRVHPDCTSSDVIGFVSDQPAFYEERYREEGRMLGIYTVAFRMVLWESERTERAGYNVVYMEDMIKITHLLQSTIEDIVEVCEYMSDQMVFREIVHRTDYESISGEELLRLKEEVRQTHLEDLFKDERFEYLEGAIKDVFCK